MKSLLALLSVGVLIFFTACGGGGGGSPTPESGYVSKYTITKASDLNNLTLRGEDRDESGSYGTFFFNEDGTYNYTDSDPQYNSKGTWSYDSDSDTINFNLTEPYLGTAYAKLNNHTLEVDANLDLYISIPFEGSDVWHAKIVSILPGEEASISSSSSEANGQSSSSSSATEDDSIPTGNSNIPDDAKSSKNIQLYQYISKSTHDILVEKYEDSIKTYSGTEKISCADLGVSKSLLQPETGIYGLNHYYSDETQERMCVEHDASTTVYSGAYFLVVYD
jgi:hypothetical protein